MGWTGFFRPCFSTYKIDTKHCSYPKRRKDGNEWAYAWADDAYNTKGDDVFPFTGLGWTYDWQGADHYKHQPHKHKQPEVGLNEFVILADRGTVVTWTTVRTPL